MDDERIADAAAIGLALPAAEGRVAREGPAPGIVIEGRRASELVDLLQVFLERVGDVVEELVLVDRSGRPAFRACAVVGDEHDQRVVPFADRLEEIEEPAIVMVGMGQETGEHLHHAGIKLLLAGRERVPVLDVGIVAGELGVLGNDAQLLLALEDPLAIGIPAIVELALVFVRPFLRHVMGRMHRARAEIHEEGLVGRDLLGIGDEGDRLICNVLGQMIALLGSLLRLDRMIVVDKLRIVLMRIAAEEAIIALEAAAQRPAFIGTGRRDLVRRGQMPFAERVGVVAMLQQHLREKAVFEGDVAVAARIARRPLGNAGHSVRMMVAPGQNAGAGRRAECRGVHVVEQQPLRGEGVDVRRLDGASIAAHLAEAGIILHDEQNIGRAGLGSQRLRPSGARDIEGPSDDAGECGSGLIFLESHLTPRSLCCLTDLAFAPAVPGAVSFAR
jgi:hypothetical protein